MINVLLLGFVPAAMIWWGRRFKDDLSSIIGLMGMAAGVGWLIGLVHVIGQP